MTADQRFTTLATLDVIGHDGLSASTRPGVAFEWSEALLQSRMEFGADDRVDPPVAHDEAATLLGFLDYQRDTLRWK